MPEMMLRVRVFLAAVFPARIGVLTLSAVLATGLVMAAAAPTE